MTTKLFTNARCFTPVDPGHPLAGREQGNIRTIAGCAILTQNGVIREIGPGEEVLEKTRGLDIDMEIDCGGGCLVPGFVDPHTHLCFHGLREAEFAMRLEGVPYLEILRQGGGILSSVRRVRAATEEELFSSTMKLAQSALAHGTTTIEIKSGYGLDSESELKMLRVIDQVGKKSFLDVVPTFMGAHAVAEEYRQQPEAFVEKVIREMLPAVADQGIARYCDVFCEEGVFSISQSRRILEAAKTLGLGIKIHADEVHDLGGAALAAAVAATSAEHLLAASDEGLKAMAAAGTLAVLLPATAYSLGKPFARGREMITLGVPVSLATDCNPGSCFCESMPFVFGLAVMGMHLSPEEALVATTLNAAYAVGMAGSCGSLEPGKKADFLILDGETPAILAYHAGVSPVRTVYKGSERVL
jgi:imidazolonepropionase